MEVAIEASWKIALREYLDSDTFRTTSQLAREAYLQERVFPPPSQVFAAFDLCPFDDVRVVILGQDPYHNPGQAMGLSFSVPNDVPVPPSLANIYKEIDSDLGEPSQCAHAGDLTAWAKQGVLLLNSVLTVRAHEAASHRDLGWQSFTDEVITQLSNKRTHIVFMLWGSYAQSKRTLIDESKHLVLTAPHPSPLSAYRGFFGCKHFSQCNVYLQKHNYETINW
jgi:uracil-DNA glycosylase